jgi:HemY protein
VLEAAWRANPHPDLAEVYAHVRPGDSARDRLTRVQALAKQAPDNPEGALAVARAAIDAREFPTARAALAPLAAAPTQRVAEMMAEIEEGDTGDIGRAREWTARAVRAARDPKWTADGLESDKWLPVSPATGRLDAFQWKVPVAELGAPARVIDETWHEPVVAPPAPSAEPVTPVASDAPRVAAEAVTLPVVMPRQRPRTDAPVADTVIPLVHSPDDPGPEAELVQEPAPEGAPQEGWWKRAFR